MSKNNFEPKELTGVEAHHMLNETLSSSMCYTSFHASDNTMVIERVLKGLMKDEETAETASN